MRAALTPATLPRRHLSHGSQCPILHILPIESAEEQARAKREANVKENNNDLKVLDQAPAKAVIGSLQKVEILNARWCEENKAGGCGRLLSLTYVSLL